MKVASASVLFCLLLLSTSFTPAAAQPVSTCADFDAWEWAQLLYESDPQQHAGLDAPPRPRGDPGSSIDHVATTPARDRLGRRYVPAGRLPGRLRRPAGG